MTNQKNITGGVVIESTRRWFLINKWFRIALLVSYEWYRTLAFAYLCHIQGIFLPGLLSGRARIIHKAISTGMTALKPWNHCIALRTFSPYKHLSAPIGRIYMTLKHEHNIRCRDELMTRPIVKDSRHSDMYPSCTVSSNIQRLCVVLVY